MNVNNTKKPPFWSVIATITVCVILGLWFTLNYFQTNAPKDIQVTQSQLERKLIQLSQNPNVLNTRFFRTLNPLVKNVQGTVVWSSDVQKIGLQFINLPNTKRADEYQLWVYDLKRSTNDKVLAGSFKKTNKNSGNFLVELNLEKKISKPYKFELVLKKNDRDDLLPLLLAQP